MTKYYIIGLIKNNSVYKQTVDITDMHPDEWAMNNDLIKDGYEITEWREIAKEQYEEFQRDELIFPWKT